MGFSYNKRVVLKKQKSRGLATFIIALGIATAFFIPYIITGHGYFIFYGDFNVQQIPFYKMCHEAVRSGNLGWNIYTDLGSDLITSYSFYLLGSPFFWITLLFPTNFVPYLMGPLLILKFGCAAFTAYLFISRFTYDKRTAEFCALLYAFSGFSIYNIFFNHFHEAIIVFPLLLLSLELLITENRRGVFGVCVGIAAITNYFFFFGMVVFTVIYFFIRLFSGSIKVKFSRFAVIITEAVLGFGISAFIVLPSVYSLLGNGRVSEFQLGWEAIMYSKEQIYLNIIECFFFPPDLPSRPVFFPGADVKWASLGGWLPVVGMSGVLAFCGAKKGHWLKRAICVFGFMAFVPVLNSAFYAFNSSYYARWFYMPILLMCLATAFAIEDRSISWKSAFRWSLFITLCFTIVIGFFPQKDSDGKLIFGLYNNAFKDALFTLRFFITCGIALLSLFILRILLLSLRSNRVAFIRGAIVLLCIVSIGYSAFFIGSGKEHSYSVEEVMIPQLIEGEVNLPDNSDNYRIDVYDGVDNTGMFLGLPTINAFHSVVNPSIMDFYTYVGVTRDVGSRPDTSHYALRNLLSVRYLLNREGGSGFIKGGNEAEMPGYTYYKTESGYFIYENENYIPYGFSYKYYVSKSYLEANYKDSERENIMLKAIVLEDEDVEKFKYLLTDFATLKEEKKQSIISSVTSDNETTDSESAQSEKALQYEHIITTDTNYETLSKDSEALALTSADSFNYSNSGFTATVTRDESTLVFFSVPYSEGFTAYVNGKETEIIKANVGFMAVLVPDGSSSIVFEYKTPYFNLGTYISLGSLLLFVIYLIISKIYISNRPQNEIYPEGDELIKQWKEYEIEDASDLFEQEEENLLDKLSDFGDIINNAVPDIKIDGGFKIDTDVFKKDGEDVDKD